VCYINLCYVDKSAICLHNEPKAIMMAPSLVDQVQVLLCERIMASNFSIGEISRDLGQGVTLLRGQIGRSS
jgi:hypothetical protein